MLYLTDVVYSEAADIWNKLKRRIARFGKPSIIFCATKAFGSVPLHQLGNRFAFTGCGFRNGTKIGGILHSQGCSHRTVEAMVSYKGYTATLKADEQDRVLKGKVIDLRDSITFEGTTVEEFLNEFHAAVDSYLEFCASIGKRPNKPYSGNVPYRTDPETHHKISVAAASRGMSLNKWMDEKLKLAAMEELMGEKYLIAGCK